MKPKITILPIFILLLISCVFGKIFGQTQSNVCTPKGTSVVAFITLENTTRMRSYYDTYYSNAYPNAEMITTYDGFSSTRKFNCHGYAWHVSDGGSDRWIGLGSPHDNDPEYGYWQDGSYVEVAGYIPYPGKVNWASGDHSAITTADPNKLISKWNEYPLMKHAVGDSPYGTSNLKYYKLNFSIVGSSVLCSSGSYSVSNTSGGSIIWDQSGGIIRSSVQGANPCSFTKNYDGGGYIEVNFTSGCGTSFTLPGKEIWVGKPQVYALSNHLVDINTGMPKTNFCLSQANECEAVHPAGDAGIDEWYWQVTGGTVYPYGSDYQYATIYPSSTSMMVEIRAHNPCGWTDWKRM